MFLQLKFNHFNIVTYPPNCIPNFSGPIFIQAHLRVTTHFCLPRFARTSLLLPRNTSKVCKNGEMPICKQDLKRRTPVSVKCTVKYYYILSLVHNLLIIRAGFLIQNWYCAILRTQHYKFMDELINIGCSESHRQNVRVRRLALQDLWCWALLFVAHS